MRTISVQRTMSISAPPNVVRQQFGDVAHHAASGVHRGVTFEVVDDDGSICRYRQTTRVGPVRLRQDLELLRTLEGPLVNTVTRGQFAGGTITFDIAPDGGGATVTATLNANISGLKALAAPLLRRSVQRAFDTALAEDRDVLESGAYTPGAAVAPA